MKTPTSRTLFLLVSSALTAVFFTSCGTLRGVGSDVGAVGHGIRHAAQ